MRTETRPEARPHRILRTSRANWLQVCRTCSLPPERRVDVVSRWLIVTRACVQPMTLTAAAIAGLLAAERATFDVWLFLLAALGLVVAHAANNMINDYFDLDAGLDTQDYPRALYAPHPVLSGLVSRRQLGRAILVANVVDAAIMGVLFAVRGWPVIAFALAGLFISVFYVAPPLRLKAHGLGEPGVFLVWGPLLVGGTSYSETGELTADVVWASVLYGLLVVSVLMGKHIDKAPWDAREGMRTLPVMLGERRAAQLTSALLVGFYAGIGVLVVTGILTPWALVAFGAVGALRKVLRTFSRPKPEEPPDGYPLWPLWFVAWAFVHARRAGALLVLGLFVGVLLS